MPQVGPRGFRFSHLSRDHQKTVQWWMRNEGSTVADERCVPEVNSFAECVGSHSYDLSMCKPEIRALETCVARMEADSVRVCACWQLGATACAAVLAGAAWVVSAKFRTHATLPHPPQSAKRNVEKAVIGARQDLRQLMLNKLRENPLTWVRRNPLKQFLR